MNGLANCVWFSQLYNPLTNDNFPDWTKFKAIANDNAEIKIPVFDRVEKIVGKEENAGYLHFLLFPLCFLKPSLSGPLKIGIMWQKVNQWKVILQGDPKKNETHEHVNKNFNFQAIATKHHTFHFNLMHRLHAKFH